MPGSVSLPHAVFFSINYSTVVVVVVGLKLGLGLGLEFILVVVHDVTTANWLLYVVSIEYKNVVYFSGIITNEMITVTLSQTTVDFST